jgi:hypothetical protein
MGRFWGLLSNMPRGGGRLRVWGMGRVRTFGSKYFLYVGGNLRRVRG